MQQWRFRNLCKIDHACTPWTLKHQVYGHATLRLRIHFSHLNQPSVSKRYSFINLCIHPSPFRHSGKLPQHSPFRCTHIFLKNPLVFWLVKIFQRKTGSYFFSKACWPSFFILVIIFSLFAFFPFSYFFKPSPLGARIRNSLQIGHSWYPKLHFIEKRRVIESIQDLHFWCFRQTITT